MVTNEQISDITQIRSRYLSSQEMIHHLRYDAIP